MMSAIEKISLYFLSAAIFSKTLRKSKVNIIRFLNEILT